VGAYVRAIGLAKAVLSEWSGYGGEERDLLCLVLFVYYLGPLSLGARSWARRP